MTAAFKPVPIWHFRGRTYRSVTGIYRALFEDSGADDLSRVVDGRITGTVRVGDEHQVVAVYCVSPPQLGAEMTVTRESAVQA